jgi:hypothetical protein
VPALPLTGGCLCGGVRFELSAPLLVSTYCHCTRCQRRTGSAAAVSGRIAPGSLTITQGDDLVAAYQPEDGFAKDFCGRCGSALWARNPVDTEMRFVRLGAFDGDPGIRPSARQFVTYAAPWEPIPDDGLPRFPERRPPDA